MNPKQDKAERVKAGRNLNRREVIGLAGAAAGAIVGFPLLSLARSVPAILSTSETLTNDGKRTYSLTMQAKDDIVIRAVAEPDKLAFDIKGTLRPKKRSSMTVPLVVLPKDSDKLSKEQEKQKEAVLHLLTVSGPFVTPQRILIIDHKLRGRVLVEFAFMGEENPARRVRVIVNLKDASGNSLAKIVHLCKDQRISAKTTVILGRRGRRFSPTPYRSEDFMFDKGLLSRIGQIAVTFEEADEPNYPAGGKSPVS